MGFLQREVRFEDQAVCYFRPSEELHADVTTVWEHRRVMFLGTDGPPQPQQNDIQYENHKLAR